MTQPLPISHSAFRIPHSPLILLALLLLATLAYAHLASADFITLDDPSYTVNAPHIATGLTPSNVAWALTHPYRGFYIPVTWISLQLDASLFSDATGRLHPSGFHLHNLVLFLLNIVLVYFILRRCAPNLSPWLAAAPAALWALHPLRVESVAWITERKDVLAGLFGFAAILVYLTSIQTKPRRTILLVTGLFTLSLLAKPMFVTLPVLLLLLDHWPLRRLGSTPPPPPNYQLPITSYRWALLEKTPLFLLALAISALTTRAHWGAAIIRDYPLDFRLANAVVSYARYLWQFLLPTHLGVYYPLPASPWPLALVVPSLVVLLALLALAFLLRKKSPGSSVGILFFLLAALPNIGLVQAFTQASADRFTYLPALGFSLLLLALLPRPADAPATSAPPRHPLNFYLLYFLTFVAVALPLTTLSYRQARLWHSPITLYEHTLAIQESTFLHNLTAGSYENRTLQLPPPSPESRLADLQSAIAHYRRTLALDPTDPIALQNLPRLLQSAAAAESAPTTHLP